MLFKKIVLLVVIHNATLNVPYSNSSGDLFFFLFFFSHLYGSIIALHQVIF